MLRCAAGFSRRARAASTCGTQAPFAAAFYSTEARLFVDGNWLMSKLEPVVAKNTQPGASGHPHLTFAPLKPFVETRLSATMSRPSSSTEVRLVGTELFTSFHRQQLPWDFHKAALEEGIEWHNFAPESPPPASFDPWRPGPILPQPPNFRAAVALAVEMVHALDSRKAPETGAVSERVPSARPHLADPVMVGAFGQAAFFPAVVRSAQRGRTTVIASTRDDWAHLLLAMPQEMRAGVVPLLLDDVLPQMVVPASVARAQAAPVDELVLRLHDALLQHSQRMLEASALFNRPGKAPRDGFVPVPEAAAAPGMPALMKEMRMTGLAWSTILRNHPALFSARQRKTSSGPMWEIKPLPQPAGAVVAASASPAPSAAPSVASLPLKPMLQAPVPKVASAAAAGSSAAAGAKPPQHRPAVHPPQPRHGAHDAPLQTQKALLTQPVAAPSKSTGAKAPETPAPGAAAGERSAPKPAPAPAARPSPATPRGRGKDSAAAAAPSTATTAPPMSPDAAPASATPNPKPEAASAAASEPTVAAAAPAPSEDSKATLKSLFKAALRTGVVADAHVTHANLLALLGAAKIPAAKSRRVAELEAAALSGAKSIGEALAALPPSPLLPAGGSAAPADAAARLVKAAWLADALPDTEPSKVNLGKLLELAGVPLPKGGKRAPADAVEAAVVENFAAIAAAVTTRSAGGGPQ